MYDSLNDRLSTLESVLGHDSTQPILEKITQIETQLEQWRQSNSLSPLPNLLNIKESNLLLPMMDQLKETMELMEQIDPEMLHLNQTPFLSCLLLEKELKMCIQSHLNTSSNLEKLKEKWNIMIISYYDLVNN